MNTRRILLGLFVLSIAGYAGLRAQNAPPLSEKERVAVVQKVKPSVVSIFAAGGQGGGTGVLISEDGYALTNFHVVQPTGPTMMCGLPDGVLYNAVLVGLDKVGDVALIKLLPKKEGQKFPFAVMGDSDKVREGDWSLAMGNPFLLATDFTPTITFGLVSGVHRYQYPEGTFLEYTDCIQIDTSINPGNSGGPLFNLKGELIGINGRGSFDKRGRVNSGVGYAISINQIKNFMGHLRGGIDSDHATLGALITTETGKTGLGKMFVTSILDESDAARRGLGLEDELISFAGRHLTSTNHFQNVMGIFPRGWRLPMTFRHEGQRKEVLVRLMGKQRKEFAADPKGDPKDPKQPQPGPGPKGPPKGATGEAAKYYEAKQGFANYYFNRQERDRLMSAFRKHGDFSGVDGNWVLDGTVRLKKLRTESKARIEIVHEKTEDGKGTKPVVKLRIDDFPYALEPVKLGQDNATLKSPETSGGLLAAMFLYHRLLTQGEKEFSKDFTYGGYEPFYPPAPEGKTVTSVADLRVDCEVLNTALGPYQVKWFFDRADQKLRGFELRLHDPEKTYEDEPCEVYFSDYREVNGRQMPHRMQIMYRDGHYGTFAFNNFNLQATAK